MHDESADRVSTTDALRVTAADLPVEPERIVIRSEDLEADTMAPAGQVWIAVDFSALGWVPAHLAVPDRVPVGGYDLRPFVPGVSTSA